MCNFFCLFVVVGFYDEPNKQNTGNLQTSSKFALNRTASFTAQCHFKLHMKKSKNELMRSLLGKTCNVLYELIFKLCTMVLENTQFRLAAGCPLKTDIAHQQKGSSQIVCSVL